jgi:hypothetical protein
VFFDPRFRTVYPSLADAPQPTQDGQYVAINVDRGRWYQDYVSKNGKWERYDVPYRPVTE